MPAWLPAWLPACLPCLPGGLPDCLTASLPPARSLLLPSIRFFSLRRRIRGANSPPRTSRSLTEHPSLSISPLHDLSRLCLCSRRRRRFCSPFLSRTDQLVASRSLYCSSAIHVRPFPREYVLPSLSTYRRFSPAISRSLTSRTLLPALPPANLSTTSFSHVASLLPETLLSPRISFSARSLPPNFRLISRLDNGTISLCGCN